MTAKTKNKTLEEILAEAGISTEEHHESRLIIWNDDVNSFEWVEYCLVAILGFTNEKAVESAWTIHIQGQDVVKTGSKEELEPYKKLLEERLLKVSID